MPLVTPMLVLGLLATQALGRFIIDFSDTYEAELNKHEDFLNIEYFGEEERLIFSALWNLKNEPELQKAIVSAYDSLKYAEDQRKFKKGFYDIFHSTYRLDGKLVLSP